ncbi:hypothetical protein KIN20_010366 [Parelaphostrongylus tenuis]|uniref:Uncharacterized protein n=1 Tax=Parelaphostrongylus tenuis TaxID=148309 RepID=A0AAD5QLD4_PARTN|nr:hypothetical protein KIN20_010366 [Parelaphostrongylus tenuis]
MAVRLQCQAVILDPTNDKVKMNEQVCIIVSNTVTGICTTTDADPNGKKCENVGLTKIIPVPANHTSISGTLSTTNIIMANWSKAMWENVINRAVRMLASGPFGSHFFSAIATVSGN